MLLSIQPSTTPIMLGVPSASILPKLMKTSKQHLLCSTAARGELYTSLQRTEGHFPSNLRNPPPSARVTHTEFVVTMNTMAIPLYETLLVK